MHLLHAPIDFEKRHAAVFSMLRRVRLYYSSGDERAALFTLYNAVASTLSLLCEAEGIQWRDIGMRGMVWELKRRHWIDFSEAGLFRKLQHLRNVAAHEHDRIDERIVSPGDMVLLFGFFEDYVQRTFKRLTNLLAMKGSDGVWIRWTNMFRIAYASLSTSLCYCFHPCPNNGQRGYEVERPGFFEVSTTHVNSYFIGIDCCCLNLD
jgi:hypothetical protein